VQIKEMKMFKVIVIYLIIILIALLVGWNIRISTDDCSNGICPLPQKYNERGDDK